MNPKSSFLTGKRIDGRKCSVVRDDVDAGRNLTATDRILTLPFILLHNMKHKSQERTKGYILWCEWSLTWFEQNSSGRIDLMMMSFGRMIISFFFSSSSFLSCFYYLPFHLFTCHQYQRYKELSRSSWSSSSEFSIVIRVAVTGDYFVQC